MMGYDGIEQLRAAPREIPLPTAFGKHCDDFVKPEPGGVR